MPGPASRPAHSLAGGDGLSEGGAVGATLRVEQTRFWRRALETLIHGRQGLADLQRHGKQSWQHRRTSDT